MLQTTIQLPPRQDTILDTQAGGRRKPKGKGKNKAKVTAKSEE